MKRVQKHQPKDDQAIKIMMRQLFEIQIELGEFNNQQHDYAGEFQAIIGTLDDLFKKVMES